MVFVIDDIFSDEDMKYMMDYMTSKNGTYKIYDPVMSGFIWDRVKPHIPAELSVTGYIKNVVCGSVTPETSLRDFHTDIPTTLSSNVCEVRYRLFTYLNTINGGDTTIMNSENDQETITNRANRSIIFDMDKPHKSESFTEGVKYWIGIELISRLKSSDT